MNFAGRSTQQSECASFFAAMPEDPLAQVMTRSLLQSFPYFYLILDFVCTL